MEDGKLSKYSGWLIDPNNTIILHIISERLLKKKQNQNPTSSIVAKFEIKMRNVFTSYAIGKSPVNA